MVFEGRVKGIAGGEVKGKAKKSIEIARNLLNYGVDINIISNSSGLSIEEIEKLK